MPPPTEPARMDPPSLSRWFADEVLPHEAQLRGFLRRQFPTVETDDVVQESYLKLLRAGAAEKIASGRAYLFTVARHTALTLFRRRKIYSDVPVNELPDWRVVDETADATAGLERQHRLELAVEAIDLLPARCREILRLAAVERMTPAQIATRLGLAESTVYVQLARGVRKCADHLRARGERP
jgi:RNA polymerase sigma factor (sigma-70 family)